MLSSPKQLPNCPTIAETSILIVFSRVLYLVVVALHECGTRKALLGP